MAQGFDAARRPTQKPRHSTAADRPAFVTGACGFIGRWLVSALLENGREVTALCRRPACLADLAHERLTVLAGGLRDTSVYSRFLTRETVVFHLAAARPLKGDLAELERTNVAEFLDLTRLCAEARVPRFVNVSTAVVFGPSHARVVDEEGELDGLPFAYAASKHRALAAIRAGAATGLDIVTVCPSIVFGPDHPHHPNKITSFIRQLLKTRIAWTVGGGLAVRNLVYVDDVVRGLVLAERLGRPGAEYILAGADICQRDLNRRVAVIAGTRLRGRVNIPRSVALTAGRLLDAVRRTPPQAGFTSAVQTLTSEWRFSSDKAVRDLGYTTTPLDVALERTVQFVKNRSADRDLAAERLPEQRRQRNRWDNIARSFPDLFPAASTQYYREREIELIRRAAGPVRGKRVLKLDLWNEAVNTQILHWMSAAGAACNGLDISHVTASRAKARTNGFTVVQADMRHVPFRHGSFDLVYTIGTLEHIEEYREALRETLRVLKPNGVIIAGVPYKWDPFLRPVLVSFLDAIGQYPYSPERSFGQREFARILESVGYRVEERTGLLAFPGVIRLVELLLLRRKVKWPRLFSLVLSPFGRLEAGSAWWRAKGYLLVVVARKPE